MSKLKLILRYISKSGKDIESMGLFSVDTVNTYISARLNQGYKLAATHSLGVRQVPEVGDEGYGLLFVLVME